MSEILGDAGSLQDVVGPSDVSINEGDVLDGYTVFVPSCLVTDHAESLQEVLESLDIQQDIASQIIAVYEGDCPAFVRLGTRSEDPECDPSQPVESRSTVDGKGTILMSNDGGLTLAKGHSTYKAIATACSKHSSQPVFALGTKIIPATDLGQYGMKVDGNTVAVRAWAGDAMIDSPGIPAINLREGEQIQINTRTGEMSIWKFDASSVQGPSTTHETHASVSADGGCQQTPEAPSSPVDAAGMTIVIATAAVLNALARR